jgi:hypothetical protein
MVREHTTLHHNQLVSVLKNVFCESTVSSGTHFTSQDFSTVLYLWLGFWKYKVDRLSDNFHNKPLDINIL